MPVSWSSHGSLCRSESAPSYVKPVSPTLPTACCYLTSPVSGVRRPELMSYRKGQRSVRGLPKTDAVTHMCIMLRQFRILQMFSTKANKSKRKEFLVYSDMIASCSCCRFVRRTSTMQISQSSIGSRELKVSPTLLHHHHQPEPLIQGRINPCFFVLFMPNSDPTI